MKPRLIILSDLWGMEKSDWINVYLENLKPKFELKYYDCCEIGIIDKTDYSEGDLHKQFVNGGIETAACNLFDMESKKIDVLAFSIGGTIAWKAALKGLDIDNFFAVSSTRLRYEAKKPNCHIKLLFGEKDNFKPNRLWLEQFKLEYEIIRNKKHQMYMETDLARKICKELIQVHHPTRRIQ